MSNASIRRLIGWLGTGLVFLICAVLIVVHFVSGWNVQRIDASAYTTVYVDANGEYKAKLDVDRMIYEQRLMNPPESELKNHPEIIALRLLSVRPSPIGTDYELRVLMPDIEDTNKELAKYGLVLPEGEDLNDLLQKSGILLINTKWTVSADQMAAAAAEIPPRTDPSTQTGTPSTSDPSTAEPQPVQPEPGSKVLDIRSYVCTERLENGDFGAQVDVYRMLADSGVGADADPATDVGARALRSLNVSCTKIAEGYRIETLSTQTTIMDDLDAAGLKITNTKWVWTTEEMEAHLGTVTPVPEPTSSSKGVLDMRKYICTERQENGEFKAAVDTYRMLVDAEINVEAKPNDNLGAKVLRSLGVSCVKTDEGYHFSTVSTLETINEDLKASGLRITNTSWTWSEEEMEAHIGKVTPLPTSVTPPPAEPTGSPETGTPGPQTEEPAPSTPAPQSEAPSQNENAITTLYGFDQTEVRKAIREAKKQKYGTSFESSEIKFNYFAVGGASTEHRNVFRIVYLITTSGGTEYLIADVYDLESETGYTASDVHLTSTSDRNTAKSTNDLAAYQVYTLSGGSMVFPENKDKSPFDNNGLVMAKSVSEAVSYDELWDIPQTSEMTLLQLLGYARNEMFARGGHQFSDTSNYYKYFKQFSWYQPTGKVTADDLAAIYPATKKNISTIKFLETLIKEG